LINWELPFFLRFLSVCRAVKESSDSGLVGGYCKLIKMLKPFVPLRDGEREETRVGCLPLVILSLKDASKSPLEMVLHVAMEGVRRHAIRPADPP
jgi:hypothetical protein